MMATSGNTPANDDFHKLLLVVKDLAQQLDENRQATTKLKLHADLLKVRCKSRQALVGLWLTGIIIVGAIAGVQILRKE